MLHTILLTANNATDVSALRGKVISYVKLHLLDRNDLSSCILKFYNENSENGDIAWLKLVKPGFNTAQVLVPDQDACFFVMDYDRCVVTDSNGQMLSGYKFALLLTEVAA
ncbi:MAG: hypothetical protein KIS94_04110 [Chitinophagales bacterium]|nr:hypothetical protein [Chitinophagales bacterium]